MKVVLWILPLVQYSPAFAVQPSLTLCLSPRRCCALSPFTSSNPVFHALSTCWSPRGGCWHSETETVSVSLSVVMNTDINSWSYLGARLRESTSCYQPFEVTISLLTIVFRFFINRTKKAIFYHEDHPSARKLFCGAFMSRSTSSSLLVLWV